MTDSKGKTKLHTLLGNYPNVIALKNGEIKSDLIDFDFPDIKVANTGFKPLVRDHKFDAGELAIVTFLQAKCYGKPYVLLPIVVVGRGQHHTIAYNPERGHLDPTDLNGKRVGLRSWPVTTSTWVRGIMTDDYGLDINTVRWIRFEDPHLAEFKDPPIVEQAPEGTNLTQMLLDGEIDAGIVGDKLPDPRLKHLIPNPEEAARKWAERNGGVPINHMIVVRDTIAKERPDIVKELYRVFSEAKQAANLPASGTPLDPIRFGIEPNRRALEVIIGYCVRQGLIPRAFTVDELFEDAARALDL